MNKHIMNTQLNNEQTQIKMRQSILHYALINFLHLYTINMKKRSQEKLIYPDLS